MFQKVGAGNHIPNEDFRHRPPGEAATNLQSVRRVIGSEAVNTVLREAHQKRLDGEVEAAALKFKRKAFVENEGALCDPDPKAKGWQHGARAPRTKAKGKTTGRWVGISKSNVREPGAPVLRRDPTAQERRTSSAPLRRRFCKSSKTILNL